jgi:glutathione S-transferase
MPIADNADITLFYAPRSRAVMGLWLLEEIGRPYRIELVDLEKGEQKKPELLKHNPMGKVPTVLDGDVAISETGAIITYLLDKYSPGDLAPHPGQRERAGYLKWLFFAPGVIEPAFAEKFLKWDVPSRSVGWGSFADMLSTVQGALSQNTWLAGDRFTGADLYVASALRYGMLFGLVPQESVIVEYVTRCTERPAFRRTSEIDERYVEQQNAAAS